MLPLSVTKLGSLITEGSFNCTSCDCLSFEGLDGGTRAPLRTGQVRLEKQVGEWRMAPVHWARPSQQWQFAREARGPGDAASVARQGMSEHGSPQQDMSGLVSVSAGATLYVFLCIFSRERRRSGRGRRCRKQPPVSETPLPSFPLCRTRRPPCCISMLWAYRCAVYNTAMCYYF